MGRRYEPRLACPVFELAPSLALTPGACGSVAAPTGCYRWPFICMMGRAQLSSVRGLRDGACLLGANAVGETLARCSGFTAAASGRLGGR